jgi:hypothetical protein
MTAPVAIRPGAAKAPQLGGGIPWDSRTAESQTVSVPSARMVPPRGTGTPSTLRDRELALRELHCRRYSMKALPELVAATIIGAV